MASFESNQPAQPVQPSSTHSTLFKTNKQQQRIDAYALDLRSKASKTSTPLLVSCIRAYSTAHCSTYDWVSNPCSHTRSLPLDSPALDLAWGQYPTPKLNKPGINPGRAFLCDGLHRRHSNLSIESIANLLRWGNLATTVQGEEERGPTVASSISLLTFERKSYSRRRCPFLIIEGLFITRQRSHKRHRSQGHRIKIQVRFPRWITLHAKGRLTYTPHTLPGWL